MSIDPKKILEGIIRQRLPEDDAPIVQLVPQGSDGGESLAAHRDAEGRVTDVSCQVRSEGCEVALNRDEVIVSDDRSTRYYTFEGKTVRGREQLFHDRDDGAPIAEEVVRGDRALIDSARRLYFEALQHPEKFEVSTFAIEAEEMLEGER